MFDTNGDGECHLCALHGGCVASGGPFKKCVTGVGSGDDLQDEMIEDAQGALVRGRELYRRIGVAAAEHDWRLPPTLHDDDHDEPTDCSWCGNAHDGGPENCVE
jgi:hypothetical protein